MNTETTVAQTTETPNQTPNQTPSQNGKKPRKAAMPAQEFLKEWLSSVQKKETLNDFCKRTGMQYQNAKGRYEDMRDYVKENYKKELPPLPTSGRTRDKVAIGQLLEGFELPDATDTTPTQKKGGGKKKGKEAQSQQEATVNQ